MKVKIEKLDHMGQGIGYINDKIVFIPNTVPDDVVDVIITKETKSYYQGVVNKVILASKKRVLPFCPYFSKCGGCQLQNMKYEDTLKYKKERVESIFKHNQLSYPDMVLVENACPRYYRNKIELKIKDGIIGFYQNKTHEVIAIKECAIAQKCINSFIPELKQMNIQNGEVCIRCNYNEELLISINTSDQLTLAFNNYPSYKVVGIVVNDKCVYGESFFLDKINNYFFEVSYNSFFQVNSYINSKLFEIINHYVQGNKVLDLYSGVGTLSIMASKNASLVYAIESVPNAVLNAIKNAKINNIKNVNFILGKVEDKITKIADDIDTIIVDPPRSGLDSKTIKVILDRKPANIIYISCETQSLVNNLKKLLCDYEIKKIYLLDMFSYTYHVECVALLSLKET